MNDNKRKEVMPSMTLDPEFIKALAIEYASKLEIFKGKAVNARMELGYNDELTGSVIVGCGEEVE